jgi:uncharacterized lipoprotein
MKSNSPLSRRALSAVLVAVVVASAGCSWIRGKSGYEKSVETRPLEIPPELDRPATDSSMEIPAVATPRAAPRTVPAAAVAGQSFVIADAPESAWRRLGLALDRIEGVTINERDQPQSVYDVSYEGESFRVKVAADGDASRISTVDQNGQDVSTAAAGRLLALLKQRLG